MIGYSTALEIIFREAGHGKGRLEKLTTRLDEAFGFVCSDSLDSPVTLPAFDNSAMDGFAFKSEHTLQASPTHPLRFKVEGSIAAGTAPPTGFAKERTCWEIMTGAGVPLDFDSVIKLEEVVIERDASLRPTAIELTRPVRRHENVRLAGEDFKVGTAAVEAGTLIQAEQILALAGLGVFRLPVWRKPRVAILSTGTELVECTSHQALKPGQIYNSSAPFLVSQLTRLGADPTFYGVVSDQTDDFFSKLKIIAQSNPDIIVTTGAVSMGRYDFVTEALKDLKADIFFHKVAIRPGKPLLFARLGEAAFFGLPGNPVSTVVGLRFFLEPYLRELLGLPRERAIGARLDASLSKPDQLRCFFKASLSVGPAGARVRILPGQASFMVSPLLKANAWAILPEPGDRLEKESIVSVVPLHGADYCWMPPSELAENSTDSSRKVHP